MTLAEIVKELDLEVLTATRDLDQRTPTAGYASDMLSRVMAHAPRDGALWITIQSHSNIVAVAAVLGLSGIVITEGERPDAQTVAKADQMRIPLLATLHPTFRIVGSLWRLGLRDA
ncbi:MAG TPA: DRTGG domain-containing protein [Candidatus Sulfotelmatobacter sp.]|nr:DRTGG domain-containing protein [Candidatus Sulfotelmatobacter sp.]